MLDDQHYCCPVEGAYRPQAAHYYMKDYAMNDYHAVKFESLVKSESKQKPSQPSQPQKEN